MGHKLPSCEVSVQISNIEGAVIIDVVKSWSWVVPVDPAPEGRN